MEATFAVEVMYTQVKNDHFSEQRFCSYFMI